MQGQSNTDAKGFDISHYQGVVNWNEVKTGNYQFVYIKSSEGHTYIDPNFVSYVQGAKSIGLAVGAYHFAWPNQDNAIDEAKLFVSLLQANPTDLMPVLDLEEPTTSGTMSAAQIVQWVRDFINYVQSQLNIKVMLYTGNWFINRFSITGLEDIPLWDSYYSNSAPPDTGGWTNWTALQNSDSGTVPGIEGSVDMDLAISLEALKGNVQVMQIGDGGAHVTDLQNKLNTQGFPCGNADSSFGPQTQGAVKALQLAHNLPVTGVVDAATQSQVDNPSWPEVKVEINGQNFNSGISVYDGTYNNTYLPLAALDTVGTTYTNKGNGVINVGGTDIKGIAYNNTAYVVWNTILVEALSIDGGFNFITPFFLQEGGKSYNHYWTQQDALADGWKAYNNGHIDEVMIDPQGNAYTFDKHQNENPNPKPQFSKYFKDIKTSDPLCTIFDSLYEKGIITPDVNGNANTITYITHAEIAQIITNVLKYLGK